MYGKVLLWLQMKSISSLILLLVRLIFSPYEVLVVFRQVRFGAEKVQRGTRLHVWVRTKFFKLLRVRDGLKFGGSREGADKSFNLQGLL